MVIASLPTTTRDEEEVRVQHHCGPLNWYFMHKRFFRGYLWINTHHSKRCTTQKKKEKKKKALSFTIILPSSESQMEPLMSLISTLSTLIDKYTKIFFRSSFFFINDLTVHAWWVGVKYERFLACTKKKKRKISGDGPWSFKLLFLSFLLDVFAN